MNWPKQAATNAFLLSSGIVLVNALVSAITPVTAFPYDDFLLLDGMWRVVQGQHAGVDFYNPIGFGLFHVGALLWQMFGAHRWILALTGAMFAEIIVLCASVVVTRRLGFSRRYVFLICALIAFEASAPSIYGWPPLLLGMGAMYNRISVAALAVVFVECFPSPAEDRHWSCGEIVCCAVLLDILFVVKISAFMLALALVAGAFVVRCYRLSPRGLLLLVALLSALIAADLYLTGMSAAGLLHDYREAAQVRRTLAGWNWLDVLGSSWAALLAVPLLALYGLIRRPATTGIWAVLLVVGCYAALQLALNISNTQPGTAYLAPLCAAVLLAWRRTEWPQRLWRLDESLPLVLPVMVLFPQMLATVAGAALGGAVRLGALTPVVIAGNGIALPVTHIVFDAEHTTGFATAVNQGVALLKALNLDRETIASLDYENPFPLLLSAPSPKGVPVVWAIGFMEAQDTLSDTTDLAGDACVVMLPRQPTQVVAGSATSVAAAAREMLAKDFIEAGKNESWIAYRRIAGCAPPAHS